MVEILKQGQYSPVPVEKQVLIILRRHQRIAGRSAAGSDAARSKTELYRFVENAHPAILADDSRKRRRSTTTLKGQMNAALQEFKTRFVQEPKAAQPQVNAQPDRHPAARPLGQEHAADHQGHEDGLGGEAAPGAGPGHRRASLRRDAARDAGERGARRAARDPDAGANPLLAVRPEQNASCWSWSRRTAAWRARSTPT